jgi:hypothetical protein
LPRPSCTLSLSVGKPRNSVQGMQRRILKRLNPHLQRGRPCISASVALMAKMIVNTRPSAEAGAPRRPAGQVDSYVQRRTAYNIVRLRRLLTASIRLSAVRSTQDVLCVCVPVVPPRGKRSRRRITGRRQVSRLSAGRSKRLRKK